MESEWHLLIDGNKSLFHFEPSRKAGNTATSSSIPRGVPRPQNLIRLDAQERYLQRQNPAMTSLGRYLVGKSSRYANASFMSFGIAIGYASNFVPEANLGALSAGLFACTVAYLAIARFWHKQKLWWDYGLQTLILALAAITPLTPKPFSAIWVIVFVALGCIGTILDINSERRSSSKDDM